MKNYLGKRPLESPESEEMPATKRPRLSSIKVEEGILEPREPLSSINTQKIPPMLSPVCVQDSADLAPPSPEPPILDLISKSQLPVAKPLDSKSPEKSPKELVPAHISPVANSNRRRQVGPCCSIKFKRWGKENVQVKLGPAPADPGKPSSENPTKKVAVLDKTIDDSIDAVIARACAERDPDPFEFSSGSESEGDIFTSPKRLSVSETTTPKVSVVASSSLNKPGLPLVPPSGGTSSSDISWTMDDSIDEVIRKANMGAPANLPANFSYFSSPSASPGHTPGAPR
uniref:Uncharacterized protein n=1 Tax=Sphaerodactylus townsendi TaxID=933632 RepID=A0ACB8FNH9_9SAUR